MKENATSEQAYEYVTEYLGSPSANKHKNWLETGECYWKLAAEFYRLTNNVFSCMGHDKQYAFIVPAKKEDFFAILKILD